MARLVQIVALLAGAMPSGGRAARSWLILPSAILLAACGARDMPEPRTQDADSPSSRLLTLALWAGHDEALGDGAPAIVQNGSVTISGPIHLPHPVSGKIVKAYERVAATPQGPRRQLLSPTQDGAGLGRLLDERTGLPTRRFDGDLIFPLGKWKKGERRSFGATEHTALGPARRRITIMIQEIDFSYRGISDSMSFILSIADAAGRILACERYVYSPGIGLAAFETDGIGPDGTGCNACPCPMAVPGGSS